MRGGTSAAIPDTSFDLSGVSYTPRGLQEGIASTYQDITGRAATPDELAKYTGIASQNGYGMQPVVNAIFSDNSNPTKQGGKYWKPDDSGTYNAADSYYFDKFGGPSSDQNSIPEAYERSNYSTRAYKATDVSNFLTKMAPDQLSKLFADVGIKGADALANQVVQASDPIRNNGSDEQRYAVMKKFGFDDAKLNEIGKAMFSAGGTKGGLNFPDVSGDFSDGNNSNYYKYTAYDPKKGLQFTGGFIPDPKKKDWMGTIIKSVILGGIGYVAAPLFSNAASSLLGSAGTTTGYAGALVPNTLSNTIGSAMAGGLTGGLGAGVSGGDVKKGILTGGILGGIGGAIGTPDITGNRMVDSSLMGAVKGGITAKVSGGDVLSGVMSGGVTGAISPTINNSFARSIVSTAVSSSINGSRARRT